MENIVYIKENGLMNYNTDGFNERNIYIHNSNDKSRINNNINSRNNDSSIVQMRINENKPEVKTVNLDKTINLEETRGNRENFVVRNSRLLNSNVRVNPNNPVARALNNNLFKK